MTPQERAEKIYNEYGRRGSWNLFDKKIIGAIAVQIEEAEREAVDEVNRVYSCDECFQKGWNIAKEKALKKAEAVAGQAGSSPNHRIIIGTAGIIATNIRTMEPDGGSL